MPRAAEGGILPGHCSALHPALHTRVISPFRLVLGPGSLTTSGYPRVIRGWKRGSKLADAPVIFEGKPEDGAAEVSSRDWIKGYIPDDPLKKYGGSELTINGLAALVGAACEVVRRALQLRGVDTSVSAAKRRRNARRWEAQRPLRPAPGPD